MPEEVCGDVARELLKHLLVASGCDKDPVPVVRAFKAFRAVNKTFRDAFEEDRMGCTYLCRYMMWLHNGIVRRRVGIDRFLKMRSRAERDRRRSSTARRASEWIFDLQASLGQDVRNYKRFINTIRYVLDGNVMRDMAVYHYAMLPPHHPEFISRDHRGLPRGSFKLSASLDPLKFPPHGTVAWAQDLVESSLPYSDDRHTITLKTVKALFQIECEEESPAARRHNRWVRENLGFTWTQALEEQLSEMELNFTAALNAQ